MSIASDLARLTEAERAEFLTSLSPAELEALAYDWRTWARPEQLEPEAYALGDKRWVVWLCLAGRGFGKTRTGSEWVRENVCGSTPLSPGKAKRVALVAETAKDARDVMVEGISGILQCHPKAFRPHYEPSKNKLTWPNGAVALIYNGTSPEQLRGPQFDLAWMDELAKYQYATDALDMLMFGLRLGDWPRLLVTTTPRPVPALKRLLAEKTTVVTKGSTLANVENLSASAVEFLKNRYQGTRLGRQELDGELIEADPGALWTQAMIEQCQMRSDESLPEMQRVVVAVDPPAKSEATRRSDDGAECGIVAVGLGKDGKGYVLGDFSVAGGPDKWGRAAVAAFDQMEADTIIAEINNGGDMVPFVIQSVRETVPVKTVTASRGKVTRAEPISALYVQGRMRHHGSFAALEDQMTAFNNINPDVTKLKDRVDALVWAVADLFPQIVKLEKPKFADKWTGRRRVGWMAS